MKRIIYVAILTGLAFAPEASARRASTAPVPASTLITGIAWDFAGVVRKAIGSDLWPVTWASDDNMYGGWGDGGGFDGNSNSTGRTSVGFARISGTPPGITGKNVWGNPPYAENKATFAGKPESMISVGGTLYCWISSAYNDNSGNPALGGPNPSPTERRLAWSSDLAKSWTLAGWKLPETTGRFEPANFINYGKDNAGARDQYVYQYGWIVGTPGTYLCRVLPANLKSDPGVVGTYQYYTGKDAGGNPVWSTAVSAAQRVFVDPNGRGLDHAVWNPALKRYIIASQGPQVQQLAVYEAPEPWGPYSTIAYYDTWGNYGTQESLGVDFAAKWISADGKTMWAVYSSVNSTSFPQADSFNLIKLTLTVASAGGTGPQITGPAAGTAFLPGQTVTATGTGTNLTWSADRIGDGLPAIAQGAGSSFTFTVPADSTTAQHIHLTLTGTGGSDARDYPIGASTLAGYWKFDEGSGTVASDSSGHASNGTLLNGPTWATGKFGKALNFPAGKSIVSVGAKASLANLNRTGFSVTAWINARSGGNGARIVDKDDNSIGWFFKMSTATTVQFVSDNGGPSRTSSGTIAANAWQHVAATWTGGTTASTAHVYVNGNLADGAGVDGAGSPGDDSGTPLSIGNRATALDRGFDGLIDDLRLYPRVLSAAEIKTLATATAP